MHALSASQIIQIWEQGQTQHDIDRALTILAKVCPDHSRAELAALTIGRRDLELLTLREMTFGKKVLCFSVCPNCKERLQFSLTTEELRTEPPKVEAQELEFCMEGFTMNVRLPNSRDLAAVANCSAADDPYQMLLQRCLAKISQNGEEIKAKKLPETVVCAVSDHIIENDPQAEVLMELNCSGCGHIWKTPFDIVTFFWKEISVYAKRLLEDIVVLSRAFGWREEDILNLSPVRRRFYLERAM